MKKEIHTNILCTAKVWFSQKRNTQFSHNIANKFLKITSQLEGSTKF